jgi:hypothetical protein
MQFARHIAASAATLAASTPPAAAAAASTPTPDSCIDVSAAELSQVDALVSAADGLLAYLRSGWAGLGSDKDFWKELGRVQFVPATLGLPGESCCYAFHARMLPLNTAQPHRSMEYKLAG